MVVLYIHVHVHVHVLSTHCSVKICISTYFSQTPDNIIFVMDGKLTHLQKKNVQVRTCIRVHVHVAQLTCTIQENMKCIMYIHVHVPA